MHFKGNYPDSVLDRKGCAAPTASIDELTRHDAHWSEILPRTKLQADTRHFFERELSPDG